MGSAVYRGDGERRGVVFRAHCVLSLHIHMKKPRPREAVACLCVWRVRDWNLRLLLPTQCAFHSADAEKPSFVRGQTNRHEAARSKYQTGLFRKDTIWTSLAVQWLGIRLPVQGTQI